MQATQRSVTSNNRTSSQQSVNSVREAIDKFDNGQINFEEVLKCLSDNNAFHSPVSLEFDNKIISIPAVLHILSTVILNRQNLESSTVKNQVFSTLEMYNKLDHNNDNGFNNNEYNIIITIFNELIRNYSNGSNNTTLLNELKLAEDNNCLSRFIGLNINKGQIKIFKDTVALTIPLCIKIITMHAGYAAAEKLFKDVLGYATVIPKVWMYIIILGAVALAIEKAIQPSFHNDQYILNNLIAIIEYIEDNSLSSSNSLSSGNRSSNSHM